MAQKHDPKNSECTKNKFCKEPFPHIQTTNEADVFECNLCPCSCPQSVEAPVTIERGEKKQANYMQVIGEHKCCTHCGDDSHVFHTDGCPPVAEPKEGWKWLSTDRYIETWSSEKYGEIHVNRSLTEHIRFSHESHIKEGLRGKLKERERHDAWLHGFNVDMTNGYNRCLDDIIRLLDEA